MFLMFAASITANAQIAPQKGFEDKLAISDKKIAAAWLKKPRTYNGNNYDLKYHCMKWIIDPDTLFILWNGCSIICGSRYQLINQVLFC